MSSSLGEIKYNKSSRSRLDEFLSVVYEKSINNRSQAQKLVKQGCVTVNGEVIKKTGFLLSAGDKIEVFMPEVVTVDAKPENIPLNIIEETDRFLVINKPAGLVVHPGAGNYNGTLVSALLYHFGGKLEGLRLERLGIVHRLDKDTSGLLVVAKDAPAVEYLSAQFKDRKVKKKYIALLYGKLDPREGTIISRIARHPVDRKKMGSYKEKGKRAETYYEVVDYYYDKSKPQNVYSLVEVEIKTGRTHQIRVHMKSLGHPVVGDAVYTGRKMINQYIPAKRQLLHAFYLKFQGPEGKYYKYEVDLPDDFVSYLSKLELIKD